MDLDTMMANIEERRKNEIKSIDVSEEDYEGGRATQENEIELDVYQENVNARSENSKRKFPAGSSQRVMEIVHDAVAGDGGRPGLARSYRRARDDSEFLRSQGSTERADWVKEQYMEEEFLPVVEIVVNFTSPDELLNSKKALKELDKYALTAGSGDGYTAAYVRSAYGNLLGARPGVSDREVIDAVRRIRRMSMEDNIRGMLGIAKKMKSQIDRGEHMASEEDYELLSRISNFK